MESELLVTLSCLCLRAGPSSGQAVSPKKKHRCGEMWTFKPKPSGRTGKENVGKDARRSGGGPGSVHSLFLILFTTHCPSLIHAPMIISLLDYIMRS